MDSKFKDAPNRLPWPPMIYAAALFLGAISGYFLPAPWPDSPSSDFLVAIGGLMIAAALFIDFKAMRTMSNAKTTIMPNKGSDHLVTNGPFALSRNPIYLANTMITIGTGLMFGIIWFIPLALIAAFLTQELAVKREEAHLDARFGKSFQEYAKKVRRWI
jgi:protein-S-isoprenylcysteine O-methyltransferase Ste14